MSINRKINHKQSALVFDLEGVLIDHIRRQAEVATKAFLSMGMAIEVTPEMYRLRSEKEFHHTPDFLLGLYVLKRFGISAQEAMQDLGRVSKLKNEPSVKKDWENIGKILEGDDSMCLGYRAYLK